MRLKRPIRSSFDLDPDEGVTGDTVRAATLEVKTRLEDLGLPAFVKTSGGKGFHVRCAVETKSPLGRSQNLCP